jgi:hypothetical protein
LDMEGDSQRSKQSANGPEVNGVALRGVVLYGVRMQEPEDDEAGALGGNCPDWVCGSNGTQLNGIELQGVALNSIRIRGTKVDDLDNLTTDARGSGCILELFSGEPK